MEDLFGVFLSPWYPFFRGEDGTNVGETSGGPRSGREEVEDARDRDLIANFQVSNAPIVGDGRGVMSSMAAI